MNCNVNISNLCQQNYIKYYCRVACTYSYIFKKVIFESEKVKSVKITKLLPKNNFLEDLKMTLLKV